jgi:hypothetical protein
MAFLRQMVTDPQGPSYGLASVMYVKGYTAKYAAKDVGKLYSKNYAMLTSVGWTLPPSTRHSSILRGIHYAVGTGGGLLD